MPRFAAGLEYDGRAYSGWQFQPGLRTVQDVVNNCLNQLQLLRISAEGHVPEESLQLFDEAIHDASAKLRAMADVKTFTEKRMAVGPGLDFGSDADSR